VVNIARRAGVAVGNVHYHFGSRDKVLCEMLEALFAEYRGSMGRAAAAHRTFFPAFEASVRAYLDYLHRYPALMRLEEESRLYYPKLYKRNVAAFLTETSDAVREATRQGDLRAMNRGEGAVVAHLLMGMLHFVDHLIQKPGHPADEAIVTACVRFVRHGLNVRS
jgi:AcrR family transcriptional regulator